MSVDFGYFALFFGFGVMWHILGSRLFGFLNLLIREDAQFNRNPAAVWAGTGALFGLDMTYIGGNIGAGDDEGTTFVSAGLATGVWFFLWLFFESVSDSSEAVTVERDVASGVRLGGFLAANGLILGRAVAGNWASFPDTLSDLMRDGWPAVVVAAVAAVVETKWRPTLKTPEPEIAERGIIPAFTYLGVAVIWVLWLGWWK